MPAAAAIGDRCVLALGCAAVTACTEAVADTSACRNLDYKKGSVARAQDLPCAAEMIAALDDLDRQSKAALDGDRQARSGRRGVAAAGDGVDVGGRRPAAPRTVGRSLARPTSTWTSATR